MKFFKDSAANQPVRKQYINVYYSKIPKRYTIDTVINAFVYGFVAGGVTCAAFMLFKLME